MSGQYVKFLEDLNSSQDRIDHRSKRVKSVVGTILGLIQNTKHPHLERIGAHNNVGSRDLCSWAIERRPDGKIHVQCYSWPTEAGGDFSIAYCTDPSWTSEDMTPMETIEGFKFAYEGLWIFVQEMCEHNFFPELKGQLQSIIDAGAE